MSTITLTLSAVSVTLADGSASLTATVHNGATVPARIVLGAFDPLHAAAPSATGWATIDQGVREIGADKAEQYTITLTAPKGTAAGTYPVRFIAYSADNAPEEYADQAKQVDIVVPAAPGPPPPKPRWWPWAVAAAALIIVVGGVGFFVLRDDGHPPHPADGADGCSQPTARRH